MARVLMLCASYPADLSSGADLRFQNLCKQHAMHNEGYLVCFGDVPEGIEPERHIGVSGFETLPPFPRTGRSMRRHLRLSDERFLAHSMPRYLREMRETVDRLVRRWDIDALICMVPPAAEIISPIELPKLLDFCDSRTLTYRRMLDNRGESMTFADRFSVHMKYIRQRQRERHLIRHFDRTTTISEADRESLLAVSGVRPEKVIVIPNGVSQAALSLEPRRSNTKRSVVFWGNLDFPPNWTAVDYFNREIFLPYLAEEGIEWHIIGKGAGESILEIAEHPLVHLHGFVEDLYSAVASHGAMVNPMVEGSGLKNKVLEAFACRLPVVSTTMGIEAVGARAGEHYLAADTPAAFSDAVLRCLEDREGTTAMTDSARQYVEEHFEWNAIGERLSGIVRELTK